jgi:hypothetical protein
MVYHPKLIYLLHGITKRENHSLFPAELTIKFAKPSQVQFSSYQPQKYAPIVYI